jgi:hypothetical protein
MARKPRDYAAEYARRIANATRRGFSRTQARGHAGPTERAIREPTWRQNPWFKPKADERVFRALERMQKGESLTAAAKAEGIAPERLKRVGYDRQYLSGTFEKTLEGKTRFSGWAISNGDDRPVLTANGEFYPAVSFDLRNTSTVSRYWSAVRRLLDGHDPRPLLQLDGLAVHDRTGQAYTLATDPNMVLLWWASLTEQEKSLFARQFGSEKVVVRRVRA